MILMLNCSYKAKDSNTQYFLELLKKELGDEAEILPIRQILSGGFLEFVKNWNRQGPLLSVRPSMWTACLPKL